MAETTDIFRVTRTAAPSVYFHLPVFTGKRQRCQQFSVEQLQSHHNYCQGGWVGKKGTELGDQGWEESGPRRKTWCPKQLLLFQFFSSVPEAARLARLGNLAELGGICQLSWGWGQGTWTQDAGPLGKQYPEGGVWKGWGKGGWLAPKGSCLGTRAKDRGGCHGDGEVSSSGSPAILCACSWCPQAPSQGSGGASEAGLPRFWE